MNSIGVWWDTKDENEQNVSVHLDTNLWLGKKLQDRSIEFGIKIENYNQIKSLHLYLPFKMDKTNFKDKIKRLVDKTELSNALFNDKMNITNSNGKVHQVAYPKESNKPPFLYCQLDNNDYKINALDFGDDQLKSSELIISFDHIPSTSEHSSIYFRFRINKVDEIYKSTTENNYILDGIFKKVGFIDFNINTIRKLPSTIVEKIKPIQFTSSNLFLMTDDFINFDFESKPVKNSRILEDKIWDSYMKWYEDEKTEAKKKVIAYHWKIPETFSDYNLYAKISYFDKNNLLFIVVILLTLVFGGVGGVIGNYATTKWFNSFAVEQNTTQQGDKG